MHFADLDFDPGFGFRHTDLDGSIDETGKVLLETGKAVSESRDLGRAALVDGLNPFPQPLRAAGDVRLLDFG